MTSEVLKFTNNENCLPKICIIPQRKLMKRRLTKIKKERNCHPAVINYLEENYKEDRIIIDEQGKVNR